MPRKGHIAKRETATDPVYNSTLVTKFVNSLMCDGKKSTAQGIFYVAMEGLEKKGGDGQPRVLLLMTTRTYRSRAFMSSARRLGIEVVVATEPRQAASVFVLRGGSEKLELLLVQRNPDARFMGGAWVFPGGAVGRHEGEGDSAHRVAAIREQTTPEFRDRYREVDLLLGGPRLPGERPGALGGQDILIAPHDLPHGAPLLGLERMPVAQADLQAVQGRNHRRAEIGASRIDDHGGDIHGIVAHLDVLPDPGRQCIVPIAELV